MNSISCPLLPIVQHTFIYALYAECLLKYLTFNVIWKREKSLQQRPGVLRSQLPLCTRVSTRRIFCSKKKLYCSPFVRFSDYKNCIVPATAPSSQHQLSDFGGDGNQQTNRSSESNAMLSFLPCRESIDDKNLPCSEWYFSFLAYTAEINAQREEHGKLETSTMTRISFFIGAPTAINFGDFFSILARLHLSVANERNGIPRCTALMNFKMRFPFRWLCHESTQ